MNRRPYVPAVAALLLAGGVLAGCGSGSSRSASVSSEPPSSTPAQQTPTSPTTTPSHPGARRPTTQSGSASPAGASGGTAAPSSGTGSGPAFLGAGAGGQGLSGAVAVLRARGFSALDTGQYRGDQTLRVLVGARQGSADAHVQQAFFFVDGHYLGTDTASPSAAIRVISQSDTQVTLGYALYRPHDALCCPTGGQAQVRFALDNGRLAPLDPIPTASATAATSRQ